MYTENYHRSCVMSREEKSNTVSKIKAKSISCSALVQKETDRGQQFAAVKSLMFAKFTVDENKRTTVRSV